MKAGHREFILYPSSFILISHLATPPQIG